MSGRKRTKEGQVTGNTLGERVKTWFRNLLNAHPNEEGTGDEIPAVLTNLNIYDGPFTAAESVK